MIDVVRFLAESGDWVGVVFCIIGFISIPVHLIGGFLYCWRNHER